VRLRLNGAVGPFGQVELENDTLWDGRTPISSDPAIAFATLDDTVTFSFPPAPPNELISPVPEPNTLALAVSGLDVAILSVIRRWRLREGLSIQEIARQTKLSRNTIRQYVRDQSLSRGMPSAAHQRLETGLGGAIYPLRRVVPMEKNSGYLPRSSIDKRRGLVKPKTVILNIDGRRIEAHASETVWHAARRHGIVIPHDCLTIAPDFAPERN
jgi:transcriptional regulator with XRE-family HTH domain